MLPTSVRVILPTVPAQPFAALRVLDIVDDPDASAARLAKVIEVDPVLSFRVLRAANASWQGSARSIGSVSRAVSLLGFTAVKAIAAAATTPLLLSDAPAGLADHWAHSIAVACASGVAAGVMGVSKNDAFSAGLLHDLGSSLLYHADRSGYRTMLERVPPGGLLAAEAETFGQAHPAVAEAALSEWQFPDTLVEAVGNHHRALRIVSPLTQAVILGEALAQSIEPCWTAEGITSVQDVAAELALERQLPRLLDRARDEIDRTVAFVGGA